VILAWAARDPRCFRLLTVPPRPFIFCCIHDCEKLSEIVMSFERTIYMSFGQAAARCHEDRQQKIFGATRARVMAKQTKITIETDSLLVLRGRSSLRAWCPQCAAEGEMIPIEGIGVISNLEPRAVEEWLESEEIHRWQTDDGAPLICLNSLLKRVQRTKTA
jgi:hypothetical protein